MSSVLASSVHADCCTIAIVFPSSSWVAGDLLGSGSSNLSVWGYDMPVGGALQLGGEGSNAGDATGQLGRGRLGGGRVLGKERLVRLKVFGPRSWWTYEAQDLRVYAITDPTREQEVEEEEQERGMVMYGSFSLPCDSLREVMAISVVWEDSSPFGPASTTNPDLRFFLTSLPGSECQQLSLMAEDTAPQGHVRLVMEVVTHATSQRPARLVLGDDTIRLGMGYCRGGTFYDEEPLMEGYFGRISMVRYSALPHKRFIKKPYAYGHDPHTLVEVMTLGTIVAFRSPHMPRVYDVIEGPSIIFQHLHGVLLYDHPIFNPTAHRRATTLAERLSWCAQLACALTTLHKERILHGDLRLDTIIVMEGPGVGPAVRLVDYGMAVVVRPGNAQVSNTMRKGYCNVDYAMAPEEEGELGYCSFQTDVWRMGCVMLQLLSGVRIEDRQVGEAFAIRHEVGVSGAANRVHHLLHQIQDGGVRELVRSMLHVVASKRPSVGSVRASLQGGGYQCPCRAR